MSEKIIEVEEVDPLELYGVNESKIDRIRSYFPKLKIITRGDELRAIGDLIEIDRFERKLSQLISYLKAHKQLTEDNITEVFESDDFSLKKQKSDKDIILHGNKGMLIKSKSANQRKMVKEIEDVDMLFAIGPAGTGKTYTAVALAVSYLKTRKVRRIILTRPAVEAGENLGFLPGDLKEKLDPYLQPLYDALNDMIPSDRLKEYLANGVIQIAPLAFMRGRTLDQAFVILDEAQNATKNQLKMFLTRMGSTAKFIVTGDLSQIDLPRKQTSGLVHSLDILKNVDGIKVVRFNEKDVMRHPLVKKIIKAYDKLEDKENNNE